MLDLLGQIGKLIINSLFGTISFDYSGYSKITHLAVSGKVIYAVWHSRILPFVYLYKNHSGTALVSQSEDGDVAVRIIKAMGNDSVRGSTTRGGMRALAEMIRKLKNDGGPALVTPDGPQGPRFKVQPGVIRLAKKTGYPILPVTYSAERIKVLSTWDRFILPFPFTRCRIIYGSPVFVPPDISKEEENQLGFQLEKELQHITADADQYFSHTIF